MARKNAKEPMQPEVEMPDDGGPDCREKPIFSDPPPPPEPEEAEEAGNPDATLAPEQREQKRLSRKPKIDHLPDGTVTLDDGTVLPLFDVGDRVVAERHVSLLAGAPWLDTRVYIVRSINDEAGEVHCTDEEVQHYACIGFRHPFTRIKLAPKKGNPFNAPKVRREQQQVAQPGDKKKRGRPKGSKNRPKDVIDAERNAKREASGR